MEQIFYLDPDDDIAVVRQRLERAQTSRVLLVVPEQNRAFRSLVNLKLLQRYAAQSALDVTLITADPIVRNLAWSLGLSTRRSLEGLSPEVAPARRGREAAAIPAGTRAQHLAGYFLLLACLLAIGAGILLLLPQASVTLTPIGEVVNLERTVVGDTALKAADLARGRLPAQVKQVLLEDMATIDTTGRRQEPTEKATGVVVFTNRSGEPVTIPQGTVVRTSTGTPVRFQTTITVTVEPASFVDAPIIAEAPGSSGNVQSWTINVVEGALAYRVSVINDRPTTGGAEKQMAVVTGADKQRLRDSLLEKLKVAALTALRKDLEPDDFLFPSSLMVNVQDESFDQELGAVSKTLSLRLRVSASAIVVPGEALLQLAKRELQAQLSGSGALVSNSLKVLPPADAEVKVEGNTITFPLRAQATVTKIIDEAQVRRDIQGKTVPEAKDLLAKKYPLAAEPHITLLNAWPLERLPFLAFRIQVRVTP